MVTAVKGRVRLRRHARRLRRARRGRNTGALLTGVFATNAINDGLGKTHALGWVDGNPGQVLNQAVGVADRLGLGVSSAHSIILKIVRSDDWRARFGERGKEGLDLSMHGEEGYNLDA